MKEYSQLMSQDNDIRRAFGTRIKELRKLKKWTQKELAAQLGIRFSQLNKYECGLHVPPAEKLIQLADLLNTSVDFLLTGDSSDKSPLHNTRLLERFRALEKFQAEDRETVIKLIDAMIVKHKVEGVLKPLERS